MAAQAEAAPAPAAPPAAAPDAAAAAPAAGPAAGPAVAAPPTHRTPAAGRRIADGDLVVVYERFDCLKEVTVAAKGHYNSRRGHFPMREWVGRPFGATVPARGGDGYVHLLAPTPELWTLALKHRTQILYAADIAQVVWNLELRPGDTVFECGTGSGSLTGALARAVGAAGRVRTFEFHAQRAELARADFAALGLGAPVEVGCRDVERDGFPPELAGAADAVFLDLPGPWRAVPSAAASLRPDGRFASFSPCIEQVQRTAAALARAGFRDARAVEVVLREMEVRPGRAPGGVEGALREQGAAIAAGAPLVRRPLKQREKRRRSESPEGEGDGDAGGGDAGGGEGGAAGAGVPSVRVRPVPRGRGHTGYLLFARKAV
jgi:tRNA (adenine57-N1/adenine58-N1)-methyltransferase